LTHRDRANYLSNSDGSTVCDAKRKRDMSEAMALGGAMSRLDLVTAQTIVAEAIGYARRAGIEPLTVVVLDDRAAVKAVGADDGTSIARFEIARGKAAGCLAFGFGAREIQKRPPAFLTAVGQLPGVTIVPVPGGVLIRHSDRAILGAVGISGDTAERDEEAAVAAIEAAGLIADTGA
jgi:uncharacterized protein GlcG (DUF336 family)